MLAHLKMIKVLSSLGSHGATILISLFHVSGNKLDDSSRFKLILTVFLFLRHSMKQILQLACSSLRRVNVLVLIDTTT